MPPLEAALLHWTSLDWGRVKHGSTDRASGVTGRLILLQAVVAVALATTGDPIAQANV